MAKINWSDITAVDVIEAIKLFDFENPEYPEPRSTFLVYNGRKYPAKHIRGMAYKVHYGVNISKEDYSGGEQTVRFFQKLGFEMQYTRQNISTRDSKNIVSPTETMQDKKATSSTKKNKTTAQVSPLKKGDSKNRIIISCENVIQQKNALQLLLNKLFNGDVVCEKNFPWMKTPAKISGVYQSLFDRLMSYRGDKEFARKNVMLRCDFVCESKKLIIEYDERQHFSEARRISLLSYQNIPTAYNKDLWIKACEDIQAKDNQPRNRDEIRAYYDSTRDIEAFRHGYTLVRIMHGQVDFYEQDALGKLKHILESFIPEAAPSVNTANRLENNNKQDSLKIGLYLQTDSVCNEGSFRHAMDLVKESDIDILVLPEVAYVPFVDEMKNGDFLDATNRDLLYSRALDFSENIGKAVVFCNIDRYGTIMSIYANAFAAEGETICKDYIKHTATDFSAFDIKNYQEYAETAFSPVYYKGFRIGLTICYDCNHAIFSRKYGLNGIDIILNSTGGNVVYDKWFKYNKARAIENHCYTFTTMGGEDKENTNNYVFGFTPDGKEMTPSLINGRYDGNRNVPGGIYVYDMGEYDGTKEIEDSINQRETVNKNQDLFIPVKDVLGFIRRGERIADNLRIVKHGRNHIVLCLVDGMDIMKPEIALKLLYHNELKRYQNKKYIIINRWDNLDMEFYRTKLSLILKVRSMENFCAVILATPELTKCFQCGKTRNAQVVAAENDQFGIDLERAGGPDSIWKNKQGMKASWRKNAEWLIESLNEN